MSRSRLHLSNEDKKQDARQHPPLHHSQHFESQSHLRPFFRDGKLFRTYYGNPCQATPVSLFSENADAPAFRAAYARIFETTQDGRHNSNRVRLAWNRTSHLPP